MLGTAWGGERTLDDYLYLPIVLTIPRTSCKMNDGDEGMVKRLSAYAKYAWGVLIYNIFVIVYGAFVRATGSGAGCGEHWPLCNGIVIPREPAVETLIEFTHRVTSGVTLPLVILLLVFAWRKFPRRSSGRLWAVLSVIFTVIEALIGAWLVLFGLTAQNQSMLRAYSMMAHLINTFLLLGCITLTAWWASWGEPTVNRSQGQKIFFVVMGILGMMVLGASGAITALGDTLFPAQSLAEGFTQDFDESAHILLRLRVMHPALAVLVSAYLAWAAFRLREEAASRVSLGLALSQSGLVVLQLILGAINVLLLAPVWMQLVHLGVTTLIWINFILVSITSLVSFDFFTSVSDHPVNDRISQDP